MRGTKFRYMYIFRNSLFQLLFDRVFKINIFGFGLLFLHFSTPFAISLFAGKDVLGYFSILKNEMNLLVSMGSLGIFHFLIPFSGLFKIRFRYIKLILFKAIILSLLFVLYKGYFSFSHEYMGVFLFCAMLIFVLISFCRSLFISSISTEYSFYYSYGFFVLVSLAVVIFRPHSEAEINVLLFWSSIIFGLTLSPSILSGVRNYLSVKAFAIFSFGQLYYGALPYVAKDSLHLLMMYFLYSSLKINSSVGDVGYFAILVTYPGIVCFLISATAPKLVSQFSMGEIVAPSYFLTHGLFSLIFAIVLGLGFTFALVFEIDVLYNFIPHEFLLIILIVALSIVEAARSMFVTFLYGCRKQNSVLFADVVPFIFVYFCFFNGYITSISRALLIMVFFSSVSLFIQLRSVHLTLSSGLISKDN